MIKNSYIEIGDDLIVDVHVYFWKFNESGYKIIVCLDDGESNITTHKGCAGFELYFIMS